MGGASYKSDSRTWDLLIRIFLYIYIPPHTLSPPQSSTMKVPEVFLFSSFSLLASLASLATADTCTDCTAVVSTIAARLMSEESLAAQGTILVGGLCPGAEDVVQCEANMPQFWKMIAALLWPGYWDPTAEWMCAEICASPEDVAMTCDDCKSGIQAAVDQLLEERTIDAIVERLLPEICNPGPTADCPEHLEGTIRQGLPMLAEAAGDDGYAQTCNAAVEGTCPVRKLRLF